MGPIQLSILHCSETINFYMAVFLCDVFTCKMICRSSYMWLWTGSWTVSTQEDSTTHACLTTWSSVWWCVLPGFAARLHFHDQNTAVSEEVKGHMSFCFNSAAVDGGKCSAWAMPCSCLTRPDPIPYTVCFGSWNHSDSEAQELYISRLLQ